MESLIINQKKLQSIMFNTFSACRKNVYTEVNKEDFRWICASTGHTHTIRRNPSGYEYTQQVESLNSDDLLRLFILEWDKFQIDLERMKMQKSLDEQTASESVFTREDMVAFAQHMRGSDNGNPRPVVDERDLKKWTTSPVESL